MVETQSLAPAEARAATRILVLWADNGSANLGVRALAEGSASLAKRAWGESSVVDFQDFEPNDSEVGFNRQGVQSDILRRGGPLKSKLRNYEVVLDTGAGDSFTDIYGIKRAMLMAYGRRIAFKNRIPLHLGPQTIGPFNTRAGRYLARYVLRNSASVIARDSESAEFVTAFGFDLDCLATDVVFGLDVPASTKSRDVIVNVSGLLWNENPHVDSSTYRSQVVGLINELRSSGREVSLMSHVLDNPSNDNDVPAQAAVSKRLDDEIEVITPVSLRDARVAVASAKLVVGSRMHCCLNALSVGTPAIPWAYSRKFAPLMNDLDWIHVVDLRTEAAPVEATLEIIAQNEPLFLKQLDSLRLAASGRLDRAANVLLAKGAS
ncbi:MAG: polysaccharide pyruvyl transferase family protein [Solirubrobacterales bacterium]